MGAVQNQLQCNYSDSFLVEIYIHESSHVAITTMALSL